MKYNIQLPFFPGFYESDLKNCDTAYWAIKEELRYYQSECDTPCPTLTEDDLDFDDDAYEKDILNAWVDAFRDKRPDFVLSIENVEMTSPKYYNFETDRVWADVELPDDWMDTVREFMVNNADWLRDRVKEDWTSYDGFMSFMSNNFDDLSHDDDEDGWKCDKSWYWHLFSGQSDRFECYLSTIIGYMMAREDKDIRWSLVYATLEDVYDGMYVVLTKEGQEKVDAYQEWYKAHHDPDQLELPLND